MLLDDISKEEVILDQDKLRPGIQKIVTPKKGESDEDALERIKSPDFVEEVIRKPKGKSENPKGEDVLRKGSYEGAIVLGNINAQKAFLPNNPWQVFRDGLTLSNQSQ